MGTSLLATLLASATPIIVLPPTVGEQQLSPPAAITVDVDAPDDGTAVVPEVIVTARRRAEDAQAVPGSLSVVGGNLLDQSYTVNTQGLTALIPSLNYSSANPRNTAFTIRGLGSSVVAVSQSNDGLEPGVGFYVDQVCHARPATAAFDFADVEQVEELRGPQGTLFGKNTTAGAINITSRAPTFEHEDFAELSYGDYDFVQAKGWSSGPLSDTVAYRVSGVSTRRDGVLENVRTGRDANTVGTQAVRGQLLFKPDDQLSTRLIADFTNFQAYCCTQVFLRVGTSQRAAARQFGGPAGLAAQFGYSPPSTNPYDRKVDIDGPLGVDTNEGGVNAITDLDLGWGTITSVTAWRFWNWDAENDRDYTGIPVQLSQHIPSRQDQYSQELRIASNGDGTLTYVAGLYGFRQRITGRPISIYGPAAARYLIGTTTGTGAGATAVPANLLDGYGQDGRTDYRVASYAGFGEVNWRILPRLTLTGGLRYTWELRGQHERRLHRDRRLCRARRAVRRGRGRVHRLRTGDRGGAVVGDRRRHAERFPGDVLRRLRLPRGGVGSRRRRGTMSRTAAPDAGTAGFSLTGVEVSPPLGRAINALAARAAMGLPERYVGPGHDACAASAGCSRGPASTRWRAWRRTRGRRSSVATPRAAARADGGPARRALRSTDVRRAGGPLRDRAGFRPPRRGRRRICGSRRAARVDREGMPAPPGRPGGVPDRALPRHPGGVPALRPGDRAPAPAADLALRRTRAGGRQPAGRDRPPRRCRRLLRLAVAANRKGVPAAQ